MLDIATVASCPQHQGSLTIKPALKRKYLAKLTAAYKKAMRALNVEFFALRLQDEELKKVEVAEAKRLRRNAHSQASYYRIKLGIKLNRSGEVQSST
jgi:hypothetical protein